MIKLNNKKITYVALADTNNSIKAPKEIWYADSNNSVKLVYRRKDALIEGEDYEKYHWLVGDGSAYINTNHNVNEELEYETKCILPENGTYLMWYRTDTPNPIMVVKNSLSSGDEGRVRISNISSIVRLTPLTDLEISTDGTSIEINGTSYTVTKQPFYDMSLRLFHAEIESRAMPEVQNNYTTNGVLCSYFRFIDTDSITIQDFIPCKLLKPVPKWLDANGIRRQVGECGMIDLVSGKFYGNVNSVGTFTVENYYERKEWLIGDGSAYIDTNIVVDVPSLYISTSFTKKVGGQTPLFGSRDSANSNGSQVFYLNPNLRLDIIMDGSNSIYIESNDIQDINQLIVDCPNKEVSVNEITVPSEIDDLSIKNSIYTFKIFSLERLNNNTSNTNTPYHGAFGNFTLNDSTHSLNLIPCTLTMDLPASMDANNIARTKGTSGMWDLVSDRFYGNVANSGTFKAVNLAEGVDYEVHQWLKTDSGNPYIQVADGYNTDNDAYLETTFKGASVNTDKDMVIGFGSDNSFGYRLFYVNSQVNIDIHKRTNGVLTSKRLSFSNSPYQICHVFINSNRYEFNSVAGNYELGSGFDTELRQNYTRILTNQSNNDMYYAETKMRVNNVEYDLIPVKLLRSIPSKYDANGIARQAGECGMYDAINDIFYGNVASSGSFTCVNDS